MSLKHTKIISYFTIATTSLALASCGNVASKLVESAGSVGGWKAEREEDGSAVVKKGSGLFGLSEVKDKDQETGRFIKGQSKIGVPFFQVTYLKEDSFKSESAKTKVNATLAGVSDSIFQNITDAAYKDLNSKLKSAGFGVVSLATLKEKDAYLGLKDGGLERDEEEFETVASGTKKGSKGLFGSSVMSITKQSEGSPMLQVNYKVKFAASQTGGGFTWSRRDTAAKAVMHVEGGATIAGGAGGATLQGDYGFGQPPFSKKDPGDFTNQTSGGKVALDSALNWVTGGRGLGADMNLKSTDSRYKAAALDALKNANTKLVAHLKSKR